MPNQSYSEKLSDPRWQRLRLKIMERDQFACKRCGSKTDTLHVHHIVYEKGLDPWDYDGHQLVTLCKACHGIADDQTVLYPYRLLMARSNLSADELWALGTCLWRLSVSGSLRHALQCLQAHAATDPSDSTHENQNH